MIQVRSFAFLALLGVVSFACKSTSAPPVPVPTTITLSAATADLSALGASTTITATVKDQNGAAMSGQTITWNSADQTVATVSGAATGTIIAVDNGTTTVTASSGSITSSAVTVNVAQVTAALAKISGDNQTGEVGAALAEQITVEQRDSRGNVIPGGTGGLIANTVVNFAVATGGGNVATASAAVGPDGRASTTWTLGGLVGAQTATATTGVISTGTVTFSATATPGQADTIVVVSGDNQQGTVGLPLTNPIVVKITDQFGNGVMGWTVEFAANDAGASVTPLMANTDADGQVSATWTLGAGTGAQTLTVTPQGSVKGSPVTVNATAVAPVTTSLLKFEGDNQIGLVGLPLNLPPAVKVEDQFGNGVADVVVDFAVTSGNGSITGATDTTDAQGIARVGSWTIDPASGSNGLDASSTGLTSVSFTATGQTAGYGIVVRFFGAQPPTASQQAAFTAAAARWTSVVFGDLDDVPVTNLNLQVCQSPSDTSLPASLSEVVDDIVIYAKVDSIDGAGDSNGNILAQAGPCYVRTGGAQPGLPLIGTMVFDEFDLANIEAAGQLGLVITHEMGHVLGFGTFWNLMINNVTFFNLLSGAGSADPFFTGQDGRTAFDQVGGTAYVAGEKVPVENTGGAGTRDSHWRESVFDRELMTGFLDAGPAPQPISIVTLGSLWDMNYLVAYANADAFAWPAPPALRAGTAGTQIEMVDDVYRGPVYGVDPSGRAVGVIRR